MIAIIDCNSFYCSCERLFRPDLWNRPVAVLSNNDGCIISRTDEAKKAGLAMGVPLYQHRKLIEEKGIAVFSSNYHLYGDLSSRVMDTLREQFGNEKVEVYSVDEAFVALDNLPAEQLRSIAKEMKETVELWTGIKVSVGVGPSKVLSKVANRLSKKDKVGSQGVIVLDSFESIRDALEKTAVDDIWGVGRQYALKLRNWGIENGWQLRNLPDEWGRKNLGGIVGVRLLKELRGLPCIPMKDPLEVKKMIATTRMFGKPAYTLKELREAVATYTGRAAEKLRRQFGAAKYLDVFVVTNGSSASSDKYQYSPQSRHRYTQLPYATANTGELIRHALPLVEQLFEPGAKYLKAGVILGEIVPDLAIQGNLFHAEHQNHQRKLMEAIDNINFSQRNDAVKFASSGTDRNWKMRQELRSKRYTTRWDELYELK